MRNLARILLELIKFVQNVCRKLLMPKLLIFHSLLYQRVITSSEMETIMRIFSFPLTFTNDLVFIKEIFKYYSKHSVNLLTLLHYGTT